jgi:hypothetical protein
VITFTMLLQGVLSALSSANALSVRDKCQGMSFSRAAKTKGKTFPCAAGCRATKRSGKANEFSG